ncbi:hypothetical protein PCC7418_2591 [Halothece sp. PCC 7418]|uniref:hypothetical protein n=1 Tax=Halothece sp. (strain PCC 7418) TaxID=65093 RepID=UPI0002A0616D|nr:hypothetical protein [Halothece sp. PCC 7418]AFZ44733.1 hypothetical protein PCC7418_2591 [Halothece sp. PCC 7418]
MYKVLIIINAQQVSNQGTILSTSPATQRMSAALKDAIVTETKEETMVKIVAAHQLLHQTSWYDPEDPSWICCPLTIELPPQFNFPNAQLFQTFRDIKGTRKWVEKHLNLRTGNQIKKVWHGNYWLPIVYTAKGPLYGEVIGETQLPNWFRQPIDFPDEKRQPLYRLGHDLLFAFTAQPSVYLLQFGFQNDTLIFDRVWPFPAAPALASIDVQKPNLYACYWQCLIQQPIQDLVISS